MPWCCDAKEANELAKNEFEHGARFKALLAKRAQLNACLDLDKHESQIVDEPHEPEDEAVSVAARRPVRSAPAVVPAARGSLESPLESRNPATIWA